MMLSYNKFSKKDALFYKRGVWKMSKKQKLYMVGNTHFDPVWLWKWDEAMASIRATFKSALDRMNEDENFTYSFATPPVFEWIKKTDPEMFEEIKERIKEGRWELAEGWWVQPDCYVALGESYVRQSLYAQKYLKENFGKISDGVFNIDSFGHNPQIPQILKKSHIDFYSFVRPEKHHVKLQKPMFKWIGLDGSEVMAFRAENAYEKELSVSISNQSEKNDDIMIVYGVTDHGGAPTKKMILEINKTENMEFSTVSRFFNEHKDCDYSVSGELITGDFGPYSNYPKIKKMNRIAEFAVQNAEIASVIAKNYDDETIEKCWHDVLFNQFHDILGGACIKEAYFDAENSFSRAIQTANEIMHYNLQSITRKMKTVGENPHDIWNLVLWNLNGSDYSGYIETEVQWMHEFEPYDKGIELMDENGEVYPCQIIEAKAVIPRFRSRFVFKAEIPSMGYKMFKVVKTYKEDEKMELNPFEFETEKLKIRFSNNGILQEITDKISGEKLCGKTLVPACYYDDGDTWCFNIDSYGKEKYNFEFAGVKIIEAGEIRTVVKLTYKFKESKLDMYYTFYTEEKYFDVSYRVNWNEKHYVFKFETDVENTHTVSVPYGSVKRGESKADVPMGTWISSSGITLTAGSIFSYNMIDNVLGLTVLRSCIYGDLRLCEIDYETDYDIISQGLSEGKIRVDFEKRSPSHSQNFLNPPVVICEANHGGILPTENSYFSLTSESVMLSAVKKCEFDDSIIIRLSEYGNKEQTSTLKIGENMFEIRVMPFEIKTLKFKDGKITETYMTEE